MNLFLILSRGIFGSVMAENCSFPPRDGKVCCMEQIEKHVINTSEVDNFLFDVVQAL